VHAVPEVASLIPLKWRYGNRLRVVCYAHGEEVTACCSSRQLTFLMHRAHGIIDVMLANSRYTAGVLRGHIDPRKVHVMNPGVDLAGFDGALDAGVKWRAEHGYTGRSGGLVVLTVGRLDPRKNHAAVVRAVAALKDRFPDLFYVAAGEGRALPALKALAQQLNVADRVLFPGSVDGPTKLALYGACDVFAMPAIRDGTDVEGFGMVFLEAGACFKPSLAGKEGGQADAVLDGETGLIVDGTNQDAVTQALERLLSDKSLREKLGTRGRAYAETFDWPRVVQRTVEVVEKT
jgi:phosphatidylinositol alpha-1,6-mannosyltransferase